MGNPCEDLAIQKERHQDPDHALTPILTVCFAKVTITEGLFP